MVVAVTGANGQLGQALQFVAGNHPDIEFVFLSSSDLDITNLLQCDQVFKQIQPDYCINAAAYTAVDKAESDQEKAFAINVTGPKNLATVCKEYHTILIHISTDFVFDGAKIEPYNEEDFPNPMGVYGETKLEGEQAIQALLTNYFIIRTSWVYSNFGSNFMKTMLRLAQEKSELSVVADQMGTPTNAVDLARAIIQIMLKNEQYKLDASLFGIYNFSNEGEASWYAFAKKIFETNQIQLKLNPITTSQFPTAAQRPKYSVLDKSKIKKAFDLTIRNWEDALEDTKLK
jgi:dTDP-4-dehydrorhamnose reductase